MSNLDNAERLILEAIKVCILLPHYPLTIHKIQQSVYDKTEIFENKRKIKLH